MIEDSIEFNNCKRGAWIDDLRYNIVKCDEFIKNNDLNEFILSIILPQNVKIEEFEPFHIVTFACFIQSLRMKGFPKINVFCHNEDIVNLLDGKIKFPNYYKKTTSILHEDSEDDKVLNLWKVVDNMTYSYTNSVTEYFNRQYFKNLDMTGLKNSLDEIYANIADHSQSNGNAFSYISYDHIREKIYIAACDFGLGIPFTLRRIHKKYKSDSEALRDSLEIGVSARTNKRNRGFGLDNVISTLSSNDMFRIISNKSFLICKGDKNNIKTYDIDFEFSGTLIYFEISTNSFPERDMEDEIIIT